MLLALLPLILSTTACHTPQVMQAKAKNIQRIAIASSPAAANGIFATLQGNVVPSGAAVASIHGNSVERSMTFNDLVLQKFPQGVVYNDFTAAVKSGLEKKGFGVVDVTARTSTVDVTDAKFGNFKVPAVSPEEADVILIPFTRFGYFATSVLASYSRFSHGQLVLVDNRTKKIIFTDWLIYKAPDGKFEYRSYDALTGDIVPAVGALQEVARTVADKVVYALE
jgi:hypothetical protein